MDSEIQFLPFGSEHVPLMRRWLREPHVAEFWQEPEDEAEFRDKFLRKLGERGVKPFIIQWRGQPIGYIQSYEAQKVGGGWWPREKPGVHGIDQFIGEAELLGKGLGTRVSDRFLRFLFADHSVTEVIADPEPRNGRAIRAYEKAGFRNEGEVTTPGGPAALLRLTRESFLGKAALDRDGALLAFQRVAGGYGGFWCVAGGWAIDFFVGEKTREHEDLEIVVLRRDWNALSAHFRAFSPSKIHAGEPPEFVPWDGKEIEERVIQLRLAPVEVESGIVEFDLLLTPSEAGQWICRRDDALRLPLEGIRGFTGEGVPYLLPEIVLLFKAKRAEEKDERDFSRVAPLLKPGQRRWLRESLERLYPRHAWIAALG